MRGMTHPPAFDGLQDRLRRSLTRERQPDSKAVEPAEESLAAEFTDHDTLLAEQLAERLEQPPRKFAKPSGETLMSRIAHMDSEPQTVRVQSLADYEDKLPTTPSAPAQQRSAPRFSVRQELGPPQEWTQDPDDAGSPFDAVPTDGNAAPRLVAAIQAKRRQRFFSGLRNFASWVVTIGVVGSIIGGAALLFLGGRSAPKQSEAILAVDAAIPTPTAPPTLVAAPAPAERPAEQQPIPPAPRIVTAPQPTEARAVTAVPPPVKKLVKPIKQVQPSTRKDATKAKSAVKASSP